MEIFPVPVSRSLGNCQHLCNQMSSEPLGELEKVRTQSPRVAWRTGRSSRQHAIKDRGGAPNAASSAPQTRGRPCFIHGTLCEEQGGELGVEGAADGSHGAALLPFTGRQFPVQRVAAIRRGDGALMRAARPFLLIPRVIFTLMFQMSVGSRSCMMDSC